MKQQFAHPRVKRRIVYMRPIFKKPKNFLNSDTVLERFHICRMWFQVNATVAEWSNATDCKSVKS